MLFGGAGFIEPSDVVLNHFKPVPVPVPTPTPAPATVSAVLAVVQNHSMPIWFWVLGVAILLVLAWLIIRKLR